LLAAISSQSCTIPIRSFLLAALSLLQLLERMRLYSFLDLVRTAELENFFDDAAVQLTLFAPSELAIASKLNLRSGAFLG